MKRLLVVRLSALGDVVHTIPAVVSLREGLPGTSIAWVVETPYRELVELVADVQPIPVRVRGWSRRPVASRGAVREALRAMRGPDVAVDFQGLIKSAMLSRLSGAPVRFGFDGNAIRERPALLFSNRQVAVDPTAHIVEQNLQLARAVGGTAEAVAPRWEAFPADPEGKLAAWRGRIVFLPGAGRPEKVWPAQRFGELSRRLRQPGVVAWGPGEEELAASTGVPLAPPTSLRELAFLLAHASLVIGGDTGPLHLAAALGTPVIGLYGPTDPGRNGPWGQLDHCIDHYRRTKSIDSITVEEVMNLLETVIRR